MKIRTDFVTNSSSSSFICCFARIADQQKAQNVIDKHEHKIKVYTADEALEEINRSSKYWCKWLEWDWAGIDVTPSKEYILRHADDKFIVITDSEDLSEDEDGNVDYDVEYYDFETDAIDDITKENGFADIDCQYGAGRDG